MKHWEGDPTAREPGEPADVGPRLLKAAEAARLLCIGKSQLWQLTNRRAIPFLRIGRSLRYDVRDLERWIEARKVKVRECR